MPSRYQAARDVCSGCGRGIRADRLDGGLCPRCQVRACLGVLADAEAAAEVRRAAEAEAAEAQAAAEAAELPEPRRGRVSAWLWR